MEFNGNTYMYDNSNKIMKCFANHFENIYNRTDCRNFDEGSNKIQIKAFGKTVNEKYSIRRPHN